MVWLGECVYNQCIFHIIICVKCYSSLIESINRKELKVFSSFFNGGKRGDRVSTIKILMEITSDVLGTI